MYRIAQDRYYEVVDINYGKGRNIEVELLSEMDKIDRKRLTIIHKMQQMEKEGQEPSEAMEEDIRKCYSEYNELKKIYIENQNDMLYEKWSLDDKRGRTEKLHTIKSAFITFRSMRGKNMAKKIFEFAEENEKKKVAGMDCCKGWGTKCMRCWNCCCPCCKCAKKKKKAPPKGSKEFRGNYLKIHDAVAMSSIKWENIGISKCNRYTRKTCIWAFALLLVFVAFILMVQFTLYSDALLVAAPKISCQNRTISVENAFTDFERQPNLRNSDMHCYCKKFLDDNGEI